jgi:hypothetical protein
MAHQIRDHRMGMPPSHRRLQKLKPLKRSLVRLQEDGEREQIVPVILHDRMPVRIANGPVVIELMREVIADTI